MWTRTPRAHQPEGKPLGDVDNAEEVRLDLGAKVIVREVLDGAEFGVSGVVTTTFHRAELVDRRPSTAVRGLPRRPLTPSAHFRGRGLRASLNELVELNTGGGRSQFRVFFRCDALPGPLPA